MTHTRENSVVTSCLLNPQCRQWVAPRFLNPVHKRVSARETMLFTPAQSGLTCSRSLVQNACRSDPNYVTVNVDCRELDSSTIYQQNNSAFVIPGDSTDTFTEYDEKSSRGRLRRSNAADRLELHFRPVHSLFIRRTLPFLPPFRERSSSPFRQESSHWGADALLRCDIEAWGNQTMKASNRRQHE